MFPSSVPLAATGRIAVLEDGQIGEPGRFASAELAAALRRKGYEVFAGGELRPEESDGVVLVGIPDRATRLGDMARTGGIAVPSGPEAYAIRPVELDGRRAVAVAGSDERGLMYGLLELERRILHLDPTLPAGRIPSALREDTGRPEVKVRGVMQFMHSADLEREWYYDPAYWESYFGMLARNRFNSFNLVFAHQTFRCR